MSPEDAQQAELLTTEQVAAFLKVSPKTLVDWRLKRQGPRFWKLHNMVRYKLADIIEWLQRTLESNDPTAL